MFKKCLSIALMSFVLIGCADTNKEPIYVNDMQISDPWEDYNRTIFKFNDALDQAILKPAAQGYQFILPDFAETGVRNVFRNLRSPLDFGNQLLQGDGEGALEILTRAMINTSFGVLGFVDLAEDAGIPYEKEDFGQTLAVWGVDYGPYIVVPVLGPASLRDHLANAAEGYVDPVRLYLFNTDEETIFYIMRGVNVVSTRADLLDVLSDLKESSIDYYAAVRSSYYQNREALIHDKDVESEPMPEVPQYDDAEL